MGRKAWECELSQENGRAPPQNSQRLKTRPTDKIKGAIFNILGDKVLNARVLIYLQERVIYPLKRFPEEPNKQFWLRRITVPGSTEGK